MNDKILSGRWIATVTVVGVFAYTACTGFLDKATVAIIIGYVIKDYFLRSDRKIQNNENGKTNTTGTGGT